VTSKLEGGRIDKQGPGVTRYQKEKRAPLAMKIRSLMENAGEGDVPRVAGLVAQKLVDNWRNTPPRLGGGNLSGDQIGPLGREKPIFFLPGTRREERPIKCKAPSGGTS